MGLQPYVDSISNVANRAKEAVNVVIIDDYVVNYWADVLVVSGTRQVDISA